MKNLITSALMILFFTITLGLVYPFAVWGIGQIIFQYQANGSLIEINGKIVGSELLGQKFVSDKYFHSRPSANEYDAANSGGSNLGPISQDLIDRIKSDIESLQTTNPNQQIPADLVTTSASGLDPHISLAAAEFQIPRIAKSRNIDETDLQALVGKYTEGKDLGILGEARVNVLKINLELDNLSKY